LICLFWVVSEAPALNVSPKNVIRKSSSVTMTCDLPEGAPVYRCYFYIKDEKNIKKSWKCELKLTGVEVVRWADVKSSASVDIYCFYTITENQIEKPSVLVTDVTHIGHF